MSGVVKPNNIRTVLQDILRPLPQKILVATSGGIDSSAVVLSALDIGKEIEIISFTFKDWFSQDFKAATRLAEKFNLKFIPVYLIALQHRRIFSYSPQVLDLDKAE